MRDTTLSAWQEKLTELFAGMRNLMDENHQEKTGRERTTTEDKLWLPPLSPQDQKKLDRLRKDRKKAKQLLIIIVISAALVGVIVLIFKLRFRIWILSSLPFWVWVLIPLTLIGIMLLIFLIRIGYTVQWTGLKGKTLWDWLEFIAKLAIPIVVLAATLGFGWWQSQLAQQQHDSDQLRTLDQQEATILQTYLDNIQNLLLNHNLLKSKPLDDVAIIARARTLTALQGLDPERKGLLAKFIYEAKLIGFQDNNNKTHGPIIYLNDADLHRAYLSGADLSGSDLSGTILSDAFLIDTNLSGANLSGAWLSDANLITDNLSRANLSRANLSGANLSGSDLSRANLSGANLSETTLGEVGIENGRTALVNLQDADLSGADLSSSDLSTAHNLTQQQLDQVFTCKYAFLPQGLTCHRTPSQ